MTHRQGKLVKGDKVIITDINSQLQALIYREEDGGAELEHATFGL